MQLDRLARVIATFFYIGFIPGAPGTYASITTCIILYSLPLYSTIAQVFLAGFLVIISILSITVSKVSGKDPPYIVIDEVTGMFVTVVGHETDGFTLLIGFILFRFFDIIKPWPIKQLEDIKGAYGIVADDVFAGIYANVIMSLGYLLIRFFTVK